MVTKLKEKVIGKIDIGDSSESGLKELVEKSKDILVNQEIIREKKLIEDYFEMVGKGKGMATVGPEETRQALQYGAAARTFASTALNKKMFNEFKELALNTGSIFESISTETEEGEQFYNLGGIGSILRFKIK